MPPRPTSVSKISPSCGWNPARRWPPPVPRGPGILRRSLQGGDQRPARNRQTDNRQVQFLGRRPGHALDERRYVGRVLGHDRQRGRVESLLLQRLDATLGPGHVLEHAHAYNRSCSTSAMPSSPGEPRGAGCRTPPHHSKREHAPLQAERPPRPTDGTITQVAISPAWKGDTRWDAWDCRNCWSYSSSSS